MLLVNCSEPLPLLAAVPSSAFPLPGAPLPHSSVGWVQAQELSRSRGGGCLAAAPPEAPGQGAEHRRTGHPRGGHPPHTPAGVAVGRGHGEGWQTSVAGTVPAQSPGVTRAAWAPSCPSAPQPRAGVPPCPRSRGRQGTPAGLRDARGALGPGTAGGRMLSVFPSSPPHAPRAPLPSILLPALG